MSLGPSDFLYLLHGAGMTLLITFWAVLGGTVLGVVFGVIRSEGPVWIAVPLGFFLDIFRSVPLLIQLVLVNSAVAILRLNLPAFSIGCGVLAIYTAAYCTELVRAGILAVPTTTRRASRSLGLTYLQDLRSVVLPIGLRVALPNWVSLALGVMKDTSIVLWIGITELLRASQSVITRTQEPMLILAVVGLAYFVMSFPISLLGARLERKMRVHD